MRTQTKVTSHRSYVWCVFLVGIKLEEVKSSPLCQCGCRPVGQGVLSVCCHQTSLPNMKSSTDCVCVGVGVGVGVGVCAVLVPIPKKDPSSSV